MNRYIWVLLLIGCASNRVSFPASYTDPLEDGLRVYGVPDIKVATYNIHSGFGFDAGWFFTAAQVKRNLRNIARVLATVSPNTNPIDVIVLNGVDFKAIRTGQVDEALFLADELLRLTGVQYRVIKQTTWINPTPGYKIRFGNALLVRLPVLVITTCSLDGDRECVIGEASNPESIWDLRTERRGFMRVVVEVSGQEVVILATHLANTTTLKRERQALQLSRNLDKYPTILLGDLNAEPGEYAYNLLTDKLIDTRALWSARSLGVGLEALATYPSNKPDQYIDHIFATSDFLPTHFATFGGACSDHLGLIADLVFAAPEQQAILKARQGRYR